MRDLSCTRSVFGSGKNADHGGHEGRVALLQHRCAERHTKPRGLCAIASVGQRRQRWHRAQQPRGNADRLYPRAPIAVKAAPQSGVPWPRRSPAAAVTQMKGSLGMQTPHASRDPRAGKSLAPPARRRLNVCQAAVHDRERARAQSRQADRAGFAWVSVVLHGRRVEPLRRRQFTNYRMDEGFGAPINDLRETKDGVYGSRQ